MPRQRARCSAFGRSLPSPTITSRDFTPFLSTRAKISTQSTGRFTGRKFETWTKSGSSLGASDARILLIHILPNAIQPLIVQASLGMAGAVLAEASLSFLGLGVPPPAPSWGVMIEEARDLSTLQAAPHALIFPGIAIALTVLAFNFIGDGLREYLDPRQRTR